MEDLPALSGRWSRPPFWMVRAATANVAVSCSIAVIIRSLWTAVFCFESGDGFVGLLVGRGLGPSRCCLFEPLLLLLLLWYITTTVQKKERKKDRQTERKKERQKDRKKERKTER